MINIFNKEDIKKFTRDLDKEIKKLDQYRPKFYEPDEDPDGNFHALCSDILKVCQNDKLREKFAGILLGEPFRNLLYQEVGKHLGYTKEEIKKKSIKKKISDAVTATTFQAPFIFNKPYYGQKTMSWRDDEEAIDEKSINSGNFKYLEISNNFFWNIFPSENKKVFSPYYIKDNKLIIHDASIELNYNSNNWISDNCTRGEKFRVKESMQKEIFGRYFKKGSVFKKIFCDLKHFPISSIYSNYSESFYTRAPLCFFNKAKNNITDFKLESDTGYYLESDNRDYNDTDRIHHFKIQKSFIGKSSFHALIDAETLKEEGKLYLETISRKITEKDLVLDAEWYKIDNYNKEHYLSNQTRIDVEGDEDVKGLNINFINQIKNGKDLWLYKFKNNHKNRERLRKFFLKNNLKKEFWGNNKYIATNTLEYLVTGDFIINVGFYFKHLYFPLNKEAPISGWYLSEFDELESIYDVVKSCILTVISKLASEHVTSHKKNFLNIFSIMDSYSKPVNLNESFQFIKGQLGASKAGLIRDAKDFESIGSGNNSVSFMTSTFNVYGTSDHKPKWNITTNPLRFDTNEELYSRVWNSILEKKISLKKNKPIFGESLSTTGREIEDKNSRHARELIVDSVLNDLTKELSKQPIKKLSDIHDWLEAEQLKFCESYYINFERHPSARDGTSRKFKRVIKKYEDMLDIDVHKNFKSRYEEFVGYDEQRDKVKKRGDIYVSKESQLKELIRKEDIEIKKFKQKFRDEYINKSEEYIWHKEFVGDCSEKDYIKSRLKNIHINEEIMKNIKFPTKKNPLLRYTTSSYNQSGKKLKKIYKKFSDANMKSSGNKSLHKDKSSLDEITFNMRRWLIEEELNAINITENGYDSSKIRERKVEDKNFFFYPKYQNASLDKVFTLKKTYKDIWDNSIISSINSILSLVVMDNSFAGDIYNEIQLRQGLDQFTFKTKNNHLKNIWLLILDFVKIQRRINFDKAFYRVGNSLHSVTAFLEGFYAYNRDLDRLMHEEDKDPESFFNPSNRYFQYFKNIKHDNFEPIKPNILKVLEKDRSNYALLQNKENMFVFINKDMNTLINVYKGVFEEMVSRTRDEINEISLTEKTHLCVLTYPLETLLGTWESLNHLKSIKRYINLIEKYDFYEIDQSIKLVKKNSHVYISKEDASFALRKPNKSSRKNNLNNLSDYLKKYKNPRYQNDRKYEQCNDILKDNSIMINANSDDCYVNREDFINYIKKDGSYRKLKDLSIPTLDNRSVGLNSFTEMSWGLNE